MALDKGGLCKGCVSVSFNPLAQPGKAASAMDIASSTHLSGAAIAHEDELESWCGFRHFASLLCLERLMIVVVPEMSEACGDLLDVVGESLDNTE